MASMRLAKWFYAVSWGAGILAFFQKLRLASDHVNRASTPNTGLLRPPPQREENSCQPGAVHSSRSAATCLEFGSDLPTKNDENDR
jgi:hypothetical protein